MKLYRANGCDFIAADDMIVRWCLRGGGEFEPVTTAFMAEAPDGAFIDIGASTGWFSVPMALVREVHAFEPLPNSQKRLLENAKLNGVDLTLHNGAASDKTGEAVLSFNSGLPLTSGASIEVGACICPSGSVAVQTWRIDDLDLPAPGLVKIDVEGHEMAVLRGAEAYIMKHRPWLVLEANTPAHKAALGGWLVNRGYTYTEADERNLLCVF